MKTNLKQNKYLLYAAICLSTLFASCDKSAEKVKTLESEIQGLNATKDSLMAVLEKDKWEGELKCLVLIEEKEAFKMIDNYDPKKDKPIRSLVMYYQQTKFLIKKYGSHIYVSFAKDDKSRINVVISVWDNNTKTWVYYTINLDCGPGTVDGKDENGMSPGARDTCCAPTCPPTCSCPPNPPSVCRGGS